MAGKIANSFELFKMSLSTLRQDKELALIPVISAVCSAVVMAVMGAGIYLTLNQKAVTATTTTTSGRAVSTGAAEFGYQPTVLTFVVGIAGYIVLAIIVCYFASVLVSGAYERLSGGDPSLGSAFGRANKRLPQILLWGLVNGTVGYILQSLRNQGIIGNIIGGLVNAAWEIVTWLVVPVIVVEGTGPIDSFKRSGHLFKKTWGENLIARAGFGLFGFLAMLVVFVVAAGLTVVSVPVGIIVGLALIAVVATVMSALSGIFRTALYLYAVNGTAPVGWDQQVLASSFGQKTGASRLLGR
jgi:hypothetical protein